MASHSSPSVDPRSDSPTPIQGAQALEAARLRAGVPTASRETLRLTIDPHTSRVTDERRISDQPAFSAPSLDAALCVDVPSGLALTLSERRELSAILGPIAQALASMLDRRIDLRVNGKSLGYGLPPSERAVSARYRVHAQAPVNAERVAASLNEEHALRAPYGRKVVLEALELQSRSLRCRPVALIGKVGNVLACVEALP